MPNTTTVEVTVANLPASVKTAQLFRVDDNVTNPYTTWLSWNDEAKQAGKCNSRCADDMNEPNNHCACLAYLTPLQIVELEAVSKMQQEELTVGASGKLSFELPAYGVVNIRFED